MLKTAITKGKMQNLYVKRGHVTLFGVLLKSKNLSSLHFNSKKMVDFGYLRLYLDIETVSCGLLEQGYTLIVT